MADRRSSCLRGAGTLVRRRYGWLALDGITAPAPHAIALSAVVARAVGFALAFALLGMLASNVAHRRSPTSSTLPWTTEDRFTVALVAVGVAWAWASRSQATEFQPPSR